jgi:hypothetical protein
MNNKSDIILTRYLYVKDEVLFSLWKSILLKNIDEALFWGYELYYSGFQEETFVLLMKLYYEFYFPFNIRAEYYLNNIIIEWLDNKKLDHLLGEFIENIIRRESLVDSFIIKYNITCYDNEIMKNHKLFGELVKISSCETEEQFINWFINFDAFEKEEKDNFKKNLDYITQILCCLLPITNTINDNKILSILKSYAISYLLYIICKPKLDRRFYMKLSESDTKPYKNPVHIKGKSRTIFKNLHIYTPNIDCKDLFYFSRIDQSIETHYELINNWLYYAVKSPIWKKRITKYNGRIDDNTHTIIFKTEDDCENFHSYFGYELDEQSKYIQPCFCTEFTNDSEIFENMGFTQCSQKIIL